MGLRHFVILNLPRKLVQIQIQLLTEEEKIVIWLHLGGLSHIFLMDVCGQLCPILECPRCPGVHTLEAPVSTPPSLSAINLGLHILDMGAKGVYNPYVGQLYFGCIEYHQAQLTQILLSMDKWVNLSLEAMSILNTSIQGYVTPGRHVLQYGGPRFSGVTQKLLQAPYPAGLPASVPGQAWIMFPNHAAQFPQSGGSDPTAS